MITLAICDDEEESRKQLLAFGKRLMGDDMPSFRMQVFSGAEELLSRDRMPEVLLLDVQMAGMDGIRAAKILRERNAETVLILVTNYVQYAIDGYDVGAFRFLKKPVAFSRFSEVVGEALRLAERQEKAQILVRGDDQAISVPVRTIRYCETEKGHVLIHTEDKCIRCYSSMAQLEDQLKEQDFFRCHTSYLVNLAAIEQVLPADIVLKDGTVLPVSKHRKKEFRECLTLYWSGAFL